MEMGQKELKYFRWFWIKRIKAIDGDNFNKLIGEIEITKATDL